MVIDTQAQIQQKIEKEVNKIIDDLIDKIKKQMPQKLKEIQSYIMGSFQTVVLTKMQEEFVSTYGNNYDVTSLDQSIMFFTPNNLRPDFSYDISKFKFNYSLKKDVRPFNFNAIDEQEVEFNTWEEADIFEEENVFSNEFHYISETIEDKDVFSPANKLLQEGGFSSLEQTYRKGRIASLQEFDNYYKKVIKPYICKRYGIKLD